MRNTGIEPDIKDVHLLAEIVVPAIRTDGPLRHQIPGVLFKPDVAAGCFEEVGNMVHDFTIGQGFVAFVAIKDCDRYSPATLTADTPVRAILDHVVDAIASPGRNPLYIVNMVECFLA